MLGWSAASRTPQAPTLLRAPVTYVAVGLNVSVANAADSVTLSGGLTGTGPLTKTGAGTLVLSADDTGLTGSTIVSAGSLQLGHTNALAGSILTLSGGTLKFSPGVGIFHVPQINGGTAAKTNVVLQDTNLTPGAVTLALGSNNAATVTYAGVMSGPGSFIKEGTGNLTLSGVNTFAGNLTVAGGTLTLTAGQQNGGNVAVNSGATLALNSGGGVGGTITLNDQATFRMLPTSNSVFPGNAITVPAGANPSILTPI